jgi:predicted nucleotidyltransferase component of viral defense system
MNREKYYQQVELLLEVLPLLNKFPAFALKGGTAINLFVRDMPRLSVDIDLCYLPIEPRNEFLINMTKLLNELADDIRKEYKVEVTPIYTNKDKQFSKLLISKENIDIKIEPNLTLRGSVYEPEVLSLCQAAQASFLQAIKINSLSLADLYGGKICAALDRQHPRDLFDIYMLYENQGLTNSIRQAIKRYNLEYNPHRLFAMKQHVLQL